MLVDSFELAGIVSEFIFIDNLYNSICNSATIREWNTCLHGTQAMEH